MTILFHSLKNYLDNELIDSSPNTLKQPAAVAVTRGRTNSKSQTGFQFKQRFPNCPLSSKSSETTNCVALFLYYFQLDLRFVKFSLGGLATRSFLLKKIPTVVQDRCQSNDG